MNLINAGVKRGRTVVSLLFMLLIVGINSYVSIPKESFPDINIPIIYVSLHLDGISPEDSERLLLRPMEKYLQSVESVKEMRSTAYQGGGNIVLEFDAGFDTDKALEDVRLEVDRGKVDLPDDAKEPTVNEVNFSQFPILVLHASGISNERELVVRVEELKDALEGIPNVLEVNISGKRDEIVEITIDPVRLESFGLRPETILQAVNRSNLLVAAGALESSEGAFSVSVPGLIETLDDFFALPILARDDAVVTLSDIASIRRSFADRESFARLDGVPTLSLEIVKRTGVNLIETVEQVRTVTDELALRYPDSPMTIVFTQDQSVQIRNMLSDLQNNVLTSVLLVMIVILGALGIRAGLLVGIAIPGSFFSGVLILFASGFTVNIVVLFALIMSVGLLVDGAIVVTEFAERRLAAGVEPRRAWTLASRRMAWPIIASTATTLAAFMPLLFWPGIVGEFMKFLPLTLIMVLSASLLMALFFIPVLGVYFFTVLRIALYGLMMAFSIAIIFFVTGWIDSPLAILLRLLLIIAALFVVVRFVRPRINAFFAKRAPQETKTEDDAEEDRFLLNLEALKGGGRLYVRVLSACTANRRRAALTVCAAVTVLIGSYVAYSRAGLGVEFFPEIEPEIASVVVHARGNLSAEARDTLVRQVEERVLRIGKNWNEFKAVYTSSGYLPNRNDRAEDIVGNIQVEFTDWQERRRADDILEEVRASVSDIPGIVVELVKQEEGPGGGKPIVAELSGGSASQLLVATRQVHEIFARAEGVVDIEDTLPVPGIEWELKIDRKEALKFDADVSVLGNYVKLVTRGLNLSSFRPDDAEDEVDIILRMPHNYRNISQLDALRLNTPFGDVPAGNFVTRTAKQATGLIRRTDQRRVYEVKADVAPGVLADSKIKELQAAVQKEDWPSALDIQFRGQQEDQQESQAFLVRAFGVALFIMALILLTQFNSFYQVLLILSAVVMSTVGVMIGLIIINKPFGIVMSGIGVIALAGIVVNNNIVLIDTFNTLYRQLGDARVAILQTGAQRLRPVLLTTITTMLGLLPLVLEANVNITERTLELGGPSTQWWSHLSSAIFFGLGFSSLLTLVVTPCLLLLPKQKARSESLA